eukprot:14566339-Alexandrium_andersonii.AAC.1
MFLKKVSEKDEGFRARFDHLLDVYRRAAARGIGPDGDDDFDGLPAGPIALCRKSLSEAGFWIDQDSNLRARDERMCPIFGPATQNLRLWP